LLIILDRRREQSLIVCAQRHILFVFLWRNSSLIVEVSTARAHTRTHTHPIRLLGMSEQLVAQAAT
jgi:hypothetical protein